MSFVVKPNSYVISQNTDQVFTASNPDSPNSTFTFKLQTQNASVNNTVGGQLTDVTSTSCRYVPSGLPTGSQKSVRAFLVVSDGASSQFISINVLTKALKEKTMAIVDEQNAEELAERAALEQRAKVMTQKIEEAQAIAISVGPSRPIGTRSRS